MAKFRSYAAIKRAAARRNKLGRTTWSISRGPRSQNRSETLISSTSWNRPIIRGRASTSRTRGASTRMLVRGAEVRSLTIASSSSRVRWEITSLGPRVKTTYLRNTGSIPRAPQGRNGKSKSNKPHLIGSNRNILLQDHQTTQTIR